MDTNSHKLHNKPHTQSFSKLTLSSAVSTGILALFSSSSAFADIAAGQDWLSQQASSAHPQSFIANPLQTQQEVAQTLQLLQQQVANTNLTDLLAQEKSSEGLVRLILLAHSQNEVLHPAWQQLVHNQNDDGGFAHVEGWQSNPLDTAFVLVALAETDYLSGLDSHSRQQWQSRISSALHYLASQQHSDGAYRISHLDNLYTSSYVLSAFTPYLNSYGQYIPTVQSLVTYLKSQQTAPATWSNQSNNKGLFLDALVAESLYPYQASNQINDFRQAFNNRVIALQADDGSWQNDAYVTSLVLRASEKLSHHPINPITSAISLSVIDAETNLSLANVHLTASASNSAQAIEVHSDTEGNLLLQDVSEGDYVFHLSKDGYASVQFRLHLQQGEQINLGQVKLSRATAVSNGQIQGVVTDKLSGSPIANATVTVVLVDSDGKKLSNIDPIITKSNAQGAYQIVLTEQQQQVSNGRFGVDVRATGYAPTQGTGIAPAGGSVLFSPALQLQTHTQALLTGRILDESGQPISDVLIVNKGNANNTTTTNTSGLFSISGLDTGQQTWQIQKEGFQIATLNFVVNEPRTYNAGDVYLSAIQRSDPSDPNSDPLPPKVGTFVITPTDAQTGQHVQGFTVTAEKLDASNNVIQTQSFTPNNEQNLATELSIELPTGKWRLTVSHPAYQANHQTFNLTDAQSINFAPALTLNPYALSADVVDSLTNQAITNAPFQVINNDNDQVLYNGKTDTNGHLSIPSNLTASNLRLEITPPLYLSTTRYINRQTESTTNVNLGEIRLRPKSAQVILPDLVVSQLDTTDLTTEQQSLITTGTLHASISNKGNAEVRDDIKITAFIDKNNNRQLDEGEQIVGSTTLTDTLAIDGTVQVDIDISGKVDFRDAPIAVMVDSDEKIAEKEDGNNVRLTSDGVEIKPEQGTLEAEMVWHWKPGSNTPYPSYDQVMASPVVAPLYDSNKNNKIDIDDERFVLFTSFSNGNYHSANGVLRIINANNGKELKSFGIKESQGFAPAPSGNIALADLNGDGVVEILVTTERGISCYTIEDGLVWHTDIVKQQGYWKPISMSAPVVFDIGNDSSPEIIIGKNILNKNGDIIYQDSSRWRGSVQISNAFHYQNKSLAVINGALYNLDGFTKLHDFVLPSSYTSSALVNTGNDETPEVVIASSQGLYLFEMDGTKKWGPIRITNRNAGSPIIADMDNNGIPDIGIATENDYLAFRLDGTLMWSIPVSDYSSSVTSSTVFDFDNDNNAEVVYADEQKLRIINGTNGEIKTQFNNISGTLYESPIIVDADNDDHADIIVVSNNYSRRHLGTTGVRMFSSKNKDWANTRHIWNQHNYHITNINDDMTVPTYEEASWLKHNTYRLNTILGVNPIAATDLTTSYLQISDNGSTTPSRFTARIGNAGGKTVAKGTPISFYRLPQGADNSQAQLLETITLTESLAGGDYVDISIDYTPANGSLADFGELIVIANDAGAGIDSATGIVNPTDPNDPNTSADTQGVIQEYTRHNNLARISITGEFTRFSLAGEVDKTHYQADETVTISAIPTNLGSFPTTPDVRVSIIDSVGNVVKQFADTPVDLGVALTNIGNPPVNSANVTHTWQTGQTRTGNYHAHIELIYQDKVVASLDRPFAIVADDINGLNAQTTSQLYVDKTQYFATDLVQIHSRLQNTASNAMATQREVHLTVADPNGDIIWTQDYNYHELAPNALKDQYFTLPLANAPSGHYTVTSTTTATDGSQAPQILTQSFKVLTASESGFGITGQITAQPQVNLGETVNWQWQVANNSNEGLTDLPLSIALFRQDESEPFATLPLSSISLDTSGKLTGSVPWVSTGQANSQVSAVLLANFAGKQKGLAQTTVTLLEPPVTVQINEQEQISDSLLVYYSCAEGWHTYVQNFSFGIFEHGCFDQRANLLQRYLDRIQVPYKLVKRPENFANEMQSGKYGQYWLLGSIEQLRPHTKKEITELAFSGDNVVVDSGLNSWLNQDLYLLAGVKHKGRVLPNHADLTVDTNKLTPPDDPIIANTPLKADGRKQMGSPYHSMWVQWLEPTDPNKTQVWATMNGQRRRLTNIAQHQEAYKDYPAITTQRYGNGMPVALSFDLVGSLYWATHANNLSPYNNNANVQELRWDNTLKQLLTDKRQVAKADYVPQEVVRIPIRLHNQGQANKRIQVDINLPTGSQWLGYKGGTDDTLAGDDTVHYQVTLKPQQQLNDVITVRLPKASGTHAIRITVLDINNQSNQQSGHILAQKESRYLVRGIDSRIQLLQQHIQPWRVFGIDGYLALNAKTQINLINTHYHNGAKQLTVYEAARLGNTLSSMQSLPDRDIQAIRLEVDELLRALQIDWYIERDGYIPPP
ncbi:carboxypeptidase regulatory-like domain-containing protein [Psychrobacter sp. I-STPA6b]|uniref:carboxypeptidase regulatory-like domain-containing protein n=1 Tax=Psychrobacter sp. I-STPA6b TaxID=2585718 RepID=UPI001D0C99BC|nr:carboxypeptidase regulatory-like domain-containing protein [Psychrobacter sp. I-STPA6b]